MRKEYLYIIILSIAIIAVILGIVSLLKIGYNNDSIEAKTENEVQYVYESENVIEASSTEEKVSPNATFALKKYYDECSHFDYEEAELPMEFVNLTEQEVKNYYPEWEVETFSDNNVVLSKEVNGLCNQHFIIKLEDDIVNVYRLGVNGELNQYKSTDIVKDYLPEEDVEQLKEGITVFGEGKVSSVLEDYE